MTQFVSKDELRARFCAALSAMYRSEVPLYGDLIELVDDVNAETEAKPEGESLAMRQLDTSTISPRMKSDPNRSPQGGTSRRDPPRQARGTGHDFAPLWADGYGARWLL